MNIQSSHQAGGVKRAWQNGEIAFLKSSDYFLPKDYQDLIASGHLHPKATSHPVIILQAGSGGAIVTTVTAFSSGPDNNFLPPWRMFAHREKQSDDFHAFVGTKLPPNSPNAHLKLSDSGAKMNKPRASWVYIKHFFTVPYTVLMRWDKVPQQLRVSDESLAQLRGDIDRKYHFQLQIARSRLTACPMSAEPAPCHGTYKGRQSTARLADRRRAPYPKTTPSLGTSALKLQKRYDTLPHYPELLSSNCLADRCNGSSGDDALMASTYNDIKRTPHITISQRYMNIQHCAWARGESSTQHLMEYSLGHTPKT